MNETITSHERKAKEDQVAISVPFKDGNIAGSVNMACKYLKKELPTGIYEEYMRKKFSVPSSHYDPRLYSLIELFLALNSGHTLDGRDGNYTARLDDSGKFLKMPEPDRLIGNERVTHDNGFNAEIVHSTHSQLSRLNYPTYFIDGKLLEMLARSKISENISLEEISFPMPAMVISLPVGAIETGGQPLCCISISKTFEWKHNFSGKYNLIDGVNEVLQKKEGSWKKIKESAYRDTERDRAKGEICPCLTIAGVLQAGECVTIKYPISGDRLKEAMSKYKDRFHADDGTIERITSDGEVDEDKLKSEAMQVEDVAILGIKLLCFMAAKKDEYKMNGDKISNSKYRRGKLMKEALWGANFIGSSYGNSMAEKGYGDNRKSREQRCHWRRMHIRGQWYGKGRNKYKTVVIDPYIVGRAEK